MIAADCAVVVHVAYRGSFVADDFAAAAADADAAAAGTGTVDAAAPVDVGAVAVAAAVVVVVDYCDDADRPADADTDSLAAVVVSDTSAGQFEMETRPGPRALRRDDTTWFVSVSIKTMKLPITLGVLQAHHKAGDRWLLTANVYLTNCPPSPYL